MKIRSIEITKFKRFTHLTINDIPESAKLIVLAGPNGSGKSSFFEALYSWYRSGWSQLGHSWDASYYAKQIVERTAEETVKGPDDLTDIVLPVRLRVRNFREAIKVSFYDPQPATEEAKRAAIYVRSAYRNDPTFQINELRRMGAIVSESRLNRFIDNDATVSSNYQRLTSQGFSALFKTEDATTTIGEFRSKIIGEIKDAMLRLFDGLVLNDLGDPLETGTFYFDKGESKSFAYHNLSGGEKAAFDLILDIIVKRKAFNDSVYCIDEPEAHMNTRLQGALLGELYDLVPPNCQLWLATHSIGMMRRARDLSAKKPGQVIFLDFGDKDFDQNVELKPEVPNRAFWHRTLNVALDDVAALIAPEIIVICEGKPRAPGASGNVAMDADCYDKIFETEFPHAKFVSAGNANEVESDRIALVGAMRGLVTGSKIIRLIDRDDRSADEISDAQGKGIKVLSKRNLESYLFDDEVLTALCASVGKPERAAKLLAAKSKALDDSKARGNAADDIKSASGSIYVEAKKILELVAVGNNAKAFMRSTLAPLLKPGMATYTALRTDIFGST